MYIYKKTNYSKRKKMEYSWNIFRPIKHQSKHKYIYVNKNTQSQYT